MKDFDHRANRACPPTRQPAVVRERRRRSTEPVLVPIVCIGCGHDLAEVPPGTEAYCPTCRRWTSTFDMSTEGAAIA